MVKYLSVALLWLAIAAVSVVGGDDEEMRKLLTRESYYRCDDYMLNYSKLVPDYYQDGQMDSINDLTAFVEEECGLNSRILRTKILMAIYENGFTEDLYDSTIIDYLISYRGMMKWLNEYGYDMVGDDNRKFDEFIRELARDAEGRYDSNTVEYLFGLFYSNEFDSFYGRLKSRDFRQSDLQEYYRNRVEHLSSNRGNQTCYAVYFGQWQPLGNLKTLGSHPDLGLLWGGKFGRWQTSLAFSVAFLEADNYYEVQNHDRIDSTNKFTALYLGVDLAYEMAQAGPFHFNLLTGLGYSGLLTVEDAEDDEKNVELGTVNLNLGLGGRLYLNKYRTWFLELQGRYNIVNFDTKAGTDLSGNVVTFGIQLGYLTLGEANEALKLLNFFD